MSESEKLNFDDIAGDRSIDAEQVLRELQPQILEVNRDGLFFQAGYAAGSRSNRIRLFWPLVAAAMLLVSAGLGAALVWQNDTAGALRLEVASLQNSSNHEVAGIVSGDIRLAEIERGDGGVSPIDQRQQVWQRLASLSPLPAGYLTARGWVETPSEMKNGERGMANGVPESNSSTVPVVPDSRPQRPATYFELMQLEREG